MTTDLPTPVKPVKKAGFSFDNKSSKQCACLYVSIVGTNNSKYGISLSYTNYGTLPDHGLNCLSLFAS